MASSSFPSGGGGTPGGSTTQVQYNNAGAFGGTTGLVWDNTNHTVNLTTVFPPVDSAGTPLNAALVAQVFSNGGSASVQGSAEYDGSTDQSPDSIKGGFFNAGQTGSGKIQTIGVEISTNYSDSTARVPNNYGLHIQSQSGVGTNNYGIYLDDQGTTNYAIKTGTGIVSLGGTFITATHTPSAANDTGTTGTVAWDASFIYICTTTNTWKRVAIATW